MSVMEACLDVENQDPPFDIAGCLSGVARRTNHAVFVNIIGGSHGESFSD